MSLRVYVETSVVSYLTSFPSRDILVATHQQLTHVWWTSRTRFELFVSEAVLAEASSGDPAAAERRMAAVASLPILQITHEVEDLARHFLVAGALPPKAFVDALHVAAAAVHRMDFLLTWNCAHIANAQIRGKLEALCRNRAHQPPMICTPQELLA